MKINEVITELKYVEPNFEREWSEAIRYPEFKRIGKSEWITLAKTGRATEIFRADDINNTDAAEPNSFANFENHWGR